MFDAKALLNAARVHLITKAFGIICCAAIGAGFAYGALLYFQAGRGAVQQPVPAVPIGAQGSLPSSVENDYRALWTRLTYAEKDVSALHDILALTMIISALFGIAVGINTYLGLKQTLESANKELATVRSVTKAAKHKIGEIRSEFPAIAKMDEALESLLNESDKRLTLEVDWINSYYGPLPELDKQSILISELTTAGFRFFDLNRHKETISRIYQGLAIFYGSRYAHDVRGNRILVEHRDRAQRYFEMAIAIDDANIRAKKDRAALLVLDETPEGIQLALKELEAIRAHGEEIPGIPMNLGILYINPGIARYRDARTIFDGLIERTQWKGGEEERQKYLPLAHYNRACALCRIAGLSTATNDEKKPASELAVKDLKDCLKTAKDGAQKDALRGQLTKDVEPGKDLERMKSNLPELLAL